MILCNMHLALHSYGVTKLHGILTVYNTTFISYRMLSLHSMQAAALVLLVPAGVGGGHVVVAAAGVVVHVGLREMPPILMRMTRVSLLHTLMR